MTDQRDEARLETAEGAEQGSVGGVPSSITRRALLRGATATVPTILTLTSGAALARSSNLIGVVQSTAENPVLCLDPASTRGAVTDYVYDLGSPPYAEVTRFSSAHRYRDKANPGTDLPPQDACKLNGTLQVKYNYSGTWVDKPRKGGLIVSSAAVASFGTRINKFDI